MDPLTATLLMQGAGGLLGGLFGGAQSRAMQKRDREYRANIMRILNPNYLNTLRNNTYNQMLAGPAYGQNVRQLFNANAATQNRLTSSLAARGLTNSGVGSIAPALGGSAMAGQLGNLRTNMYNEAGHEAERQQNLLLQALQDMGPQKYYNYGSQAMGGALADMGNTLKDYYKNKWNSRGPGPWAGQYGT